MQFSFIVVNNNEPALAETILLFDSFPNYFCVGNFKDTQTAINSIIKSKPHLVLIGIDETVEGNDALFKVMGEMLQYSNPLPYLIATAPSNKFAINAIQNGFSDYIIGGITAHELAKTLFKFEKRVPEKKSTTICIKSYSDYQFVNLEDVVYLKADNNTTDIQLINGKVVNAYKTLKHFENALPFYFLRIHKSYVVNINHVSRIHFSKSKCYINYNEVLPFSLTYRKNIEAIIRKIDL
ncbi:DNA-binding LytR/AlgR family response regulator [Flavobacterium arsenatis]|uniref:DNA-binding LytR/AlgR family response regulator n=1 Tax=Flavobacterium arsenatis TaxID=1484332 RepID=A0ABU1TQF9_9FLAO|nr:LytTR family transcriptional regulator DNA-binding domain-containing protein [Flavobacterium arsenatis]MDR6968210.1 DNA-binding LytR/AlgR family response regulator [Flavobacterium arsenatis]